MDSIRIFKFNKIDYDIFCFYIQKDIVKRKNIEP